MGELVRATLGNLGEPQGPSEGRWAEGVESLGSLQVKTARTNRRANKNLRKTVCWGETEVTRGRVLPGVDLPGS